MKKHFNLILSSIIIFATLIFTSNAFAYDEDINETLRQLGVCPAYLTDDKLDDYATREDMAVLVSGLLDQSKKSPEITVFNDVSSDNANSGYIKYAYEKGIILGADNMMFNPKDNATADAVYLTVLRALGYGTNLSSEEINMLSDAIRLNEKVSAIGANAITNKDMLRIVYNALTVPMRRLDVVEMENIIDDNKTILSDVMGISVYEGKVTEVSQKNNKLRFFVEENVYETNETILLPGTNISYDINDNTLFMYEDAPVYLWVNKDGKVVRVYTKRNTSVKYEVIYSVNGDTTEGNRYGIGGMQSIRFYNDKTKYEIAPGAEMTYNGEKTDLPVDIIGKYVRVVRVDNKVTSIESWELTKGGIVTEVSSDYIQYANSGNNKLKLKNISDYDECRIIINGKATSYDNLKKDSVVNFYKKDEYLVIINTENMRRETFDTYGQKKIVLGGIEYDCDNTAYSVDKINYNTSKYNSLFGVLVDAFFDETNKCVFVRKSDDALEKSARNFIAAVDKVYLDEDIDRNVLKLIVLEPGIEKKEFVMVKQSKMKYYDGITLSDLESNKKNLNLAGIYEFEVNSAGEIKSVKAPEPYFGIQTSLFEVGTLSDTQTPWIDGVPDDTIGAQWTKSISFNESRFVALHNTQDSFSATEITWENLRNTRLLRGSTKFLIIGEDKNVDPRLVVVCGVENRAYDKYSKLGIMLENTEFYDDKTDSVKHELIINDTKFEVSQAIGETLPKRAILVYDSASDFADDDINISDVMDISGTIDTWNIDPWGQAQQSSVIGLRRGTISMIDDNRVCFTNDSCYYYYNYIGTYKYVRNQGKLIPISRDEISSGDNVICGMSDTVRFLILVD